MPNQNKGTAKAGKDVSFKRIFNAGIPEEIQGKLDVDYFIDIPNASTAMQALEFLQDQNNELALTEHHTPKEIARMWKGTFRGCLAHGLAIPFGLRGYARRLGIVLAE